MGLLLPDPCDPLCPDDFKVKARESLAKVQGEPGASDEAIRKSLLKFIGDFANWDLATNPIYLEVSRGLIKAAHPEETPLVVDPFAGGGSIPLEALRLGCEAFASDLNPVACLILKVLLEDIPRYGKELADELRKAGDEIKEEAARELADFYPADPDGSRPIAYLWARTVKCEAPDCGAEIPLARSFWLCKKANRKRALRYRVSRPDSSQEVVPSIEFEIFEPDSDRDVPSGTVSRAKARCIACNATMSPSRVRAQLMEQNGGADVIFDDHGRRLGGARLLAIVVSIAQDKKRHYRLPSEEDYEDVFRAKCSLRQRNIQDSEHGFSAVPNEKLPLMSGTFNVPIYGMNQWGDLFTERQKLTLLVLSEKLRTLAGESGVESGARELASLAITRFADDFSSLCRWMPRETPGPTFTRNALPMLWDFCEIWPFDDASWSLWGSFQWVEKAARNIAVIRKPGQTQLSDACNSPLPDGSCAIWFTDPPYYFAIPYADLSDFFFVWLRRMLPHHPLLRDPFDDKNPLTPKEAELCQMAHWDPERYFHKDKEFFEEGMNGAFSEGRRVLMSNGLACVVFAHKTTEGWEALLSGMIKANWTITASWPIHTERPGRLRAQDSAALATSVHLVCRPRSEESETGDWADVKAEMDIRVQKWMKELLSEGIRGADAIFSCIGPALEAYSRYKKVETPAGNVVPLGGEPEAIEPHERGFLAYIFEAVSREALRQVLGEAETEGFEEDARLTALFLWTIQTARTNNTKETEEEEGEDVELDEEEEEQREAKGGLAMPFDTFIRITRPMGIHYQNWEDRIIRIKKGVVRLIPVAERQEALFGEEVSSLPVEFGVGPKQLTLFDAPGQVRGARVAGRASSKQLEDLTTLDRLHRAMLLSGAGRTALLRRVLEEELQEGKRFERLALSLTALYPEGSQERRWLEVVQNAMKR